MPALNELAITSLWLAVTNYVRSVHFAVEWTLVALALFTLKWTLSNYTWVRYRFLNSCTDFWAVGCNYQNSMTLPIANPSLKRAQTNDFDT
jgi:hypothetical protein